jgi:CHAD domain-containing protein/CYTH domain-containing protein
VLTLPACTAARRLTAGLLEDWDRTRPRLDDPDDLEALHDFRVALRRLRSAIRAFRPACETLVRGRTRRRLRRLAAATGVSRDLQVQRIWVNDRLSRLGPRQRPEVRWFLARLDAQEAAANDDLGQRLERRYSPLVERLRAELSPGLETGDQEPEKASPLASQVVAAALRNGADELARHLAGITAITDEASAHAARIRVKRLRYLLTLFEAELPGAAAAIEQLKQLQDLLGDLHDLHRLAAGLHAAFREAAVHRADHAYHELLPWGEIGAEVPKKPPTSGGLVALAAGVRTEGEALFARLRREWLDTGAADTLGVELRNLSDLAASRRRPGMEIERKFLLSALPSMPSSARSEEIEQGWLPGKALVERLRHVQSPEGESWFRTVKSGAGIERLEIEEPTTRELFGALWPLTDGCRVRKRRYLVGEGALTWEVDQFLDRELVLAEIELPAVDARIDIPEWLGQCLIREVTGEPEYVNRTLAR